MDRLRAHGYQEHHFLPLEDEEEAKRRVTAALEAYSGPIHDYKATVTKIALGGHALQFLTNLNRSWSQIAHPGTRLTSSEKYALGVLNRYYEMLDPWEAAFWKCRFRKIALARMLKYFIV
jgi:hypothetical protein